MYPLCLDVENRLCLVIGGGQVGARKVRGLLAAGARVRVISPELCPELARLARAGQCEWQARTYQNGDLNGVLLAFAATDDPGVQDRVVREARERGVLVNVIDRPDRCDFHVPAAVRRDDLVLAVSTGGRSPALAARIRRQLEERYGPEYGQLARILGALRPLVIEIGSTPKERKHLFAELVHPDMAEWIRQEQWPRLRRHIGEVLGRDLDLEAVLKQAGTSS